MIYLSGKCNVPWLARQHHYGCMWTYKMSGTLPSGTWWAADNGCYPAGVYDHAAAMRGLQRQIDAVGTDKLLFIVVPDMPFDADETLRRFGEWRRAFATLDLPLAFVTQDGMGAEDVPWSDIASVFIGGSTEWKTDLDSIDIATEAKRRGKWLHMGRVNSLQRLRSAVAMGCDSVDGTYLKFGPDRNGPRLRAMVEAVLTQQPFWPLVNP